MSICKYCTDRNTWDCEDCHPKNGCEFFKLDFDTLSKRQQKAIRNTLIAQERTSRTDWY